MNYVQFVVRLTDALGDLQRDVNLPVTIPNAIELAEGRCYRDLQLLNAVVAGSTYATPSTRQITLPSTQGTFVSITEVNVITPVGGTPSTGLRNPLTRVSPKMVNYLFPTDVSTTGTVPSIFAMHTDQIVTMGAAPGSSFTVEFIGTYRPAALSSANSSTYLTTYLPDLFFSAAMTAVCYSLGDKAEAKGQYWGSMYLSAIQSANIEQAKAKYSEYYTPTQLPSVQDSHGTQGSPG